MAIQTFTSGQVLTAAQLNTLQQQAVMTFTNEAARDAALTSPTEGMVAYLTAPTVPAATGTTTSLPTGIITIYNGTVWVCITSVGTSSSGASNNFTTSYADMTIAGAVSSVTLVTGTTALVSYAGRINGNGNFAALSVKTGTVAASDNWSVYNQVSGYVTVGRSFVMTGLTAGTNTFTLQGKNNVAGANCDQVSLNVQGIA
ncbi:hypothetical protein UFOVP943_32 [uncultured Caudovirales phage]|uniref:Uncharacterized protein n=1 Tax=uncultured Caudovirales phage TaxID=2100421 RepID=A0A6J5PNM9_9CAUD|nr:hypothetical protein UFOVP943_32 [uncultured Caudovirales phage]CAB4184052.1 hypothetical protein UFOVP1111_27 [uncultured Caudovirales phage]CAB4203330.1 hypothetical protein UFOVP1380_32 [uncultured Caudovirales phage]